MREVRAKVKVELTLIVFFNGGLISDHLLLLLEDGEGNEDVICLVMLRLRVSGDLVKLS